MDSKRRGDMGHHRFDLDDIDVIMFNHRTGGIKKLAFHPRFESSLLTGTKDMTTRTSIKIDMNNRFTAFGAFFKVLWIRKERLGNIAKKFWKREGCDSEEDFITFWNNVIYPDQPFKPEEYAYLHHFKRIYFESERPELVNTENHTEFKPKKNFRGKPTLYNF